MDELSRAPGPVVEDGLDGVLKLDVEGVLDAALGLGLEVGRALDATVERGLTIGSMTREYLGAPFRKGVTTDLPEPAPW